MAAAPEWTIEKLSRACIKHDELCTWTFAINNRQSAVTPCKHVVKATKDARASRANGGPSTCGDYTVTSGWSGQFGEGKGFTTLAVVDNKKRQIVFPAYTDNQVKGGEVVQPDQSYSPQNLPKA
ncbi:small secreted protein [Ophiocordyceps sinensis CO18]|nr:small secreted protein [Ophiocordyceps sinensis CO18]